MLSGVGGPQSGLPQRENRLLNLVLSLARQQFLSLLLLVFGEGDEEKLRKDSAVVLGMERRKKIKVLLRGGRGRGHTRTERGRNERNGLESTSWFALCNARTRKMFKE